MKIFLISPVQDAESKEFERVRNYVASLEGASHQVHWPFRDTNQVDPTGGYEICKTNFKGILDADEIHIWYNETSGGSKFDMGGVFMLVEMLGYKKKVVIANEGEVADNAPKSFYKVFKRLVKKTN